MSKEEVICSLKYFNIIQKLNKKWCKKGQLNRQQEAQLSLYCLPGYSCIVTIGFNYSYEEKSFIIDIQSRTSAIFWFHLALWFFKS
jgi:hypothetical protein